MAQSVVVFGASGYIGAFPARRGRLADFYPSQSFHSSIYREDLKKGEIFNVSLETAPTYQELAKAASAAAGHKNAPVEVKNTEGWSAFADITIVLSSRKAEQLLGWRAKHLDFISEMEIYYQSWKASQAK